MNGDMSPLAIVTCLVGSVLVAVLVVGVTAVNPTEQGTIYPISIVEISPGVQCAIHRKAPVNCWKD